MFSNFSVKETHTEAEKKRKYSDYASRLNLRLYATVFESKGAFSRDMSLVLRECAANANQSIFADNSDDRTWASRSFKLYWSQRISIAFWRGSYQMHLTRMNALGRSTRDSEPSGAVGDGEPSDVAPESPVIRGTTPAAVVQRILASSSPAGSEQSPTTGSPSIFATPQAATPQRSRGGHAASSPASA